jgi:hypothetical protein
VGEDNPKYETSIPFTNQTSRTVHFVDVTTSCGCSGAYLDSETLAPGKETNLHVGINLTGRSGFQRILVVLVEDSGLPWKHEIELPVYPRARFERENQASELPRYQPGSELSGNVTLELHASRNDSLPDGVLFAVGNKSLKLSQQAPVITQIAESVWVCRIPLAYSCTVPAQPGPFCTSFKANYTVRGTSHQLACDIPGVVTSMFDVTPGYAFVRYADKPQSVKIAVRRTDGTPLELSLVPESLKDGIDLSIEPGLHASSAVLTLSLRRKPTDKAVWGEILLKTNHDKQTTIKIPFAGVPAKG